MGPRVSNIEVHAEVRVGLFEPDPCVWPRQRNVQETGQNNSVIGGRNSSV